MDWKWKRDEEFRTLTTRKGLLLCGGDMRGFYIIWGPVAHPTWGTGTRREGSCINQGRLGLGDSVQLVISGPLWPPGKNDLSHSPALPVSQPRPAVGPGSVAVDPSGREGGRAEETGDLAPLAQFSSAQGLLGRNRSSARPRPASDSPCFTGRSDRSRALCGRL